MIAWEERLKWPIRRKTIVSQSFDECKFSFSWLRTFRPGQPMSAASLSESTKHHCHLLLWHWCYCPTEARRLSWPRHYSNGVQPVYILYIELLTTNVIWRWFLFGCVSPMSAVAVRKCWNGSLPAWTPSTFGSRLCALRKSGEEFCILWKVEYGKCDNFLRIVEQQQQICSCGLLFLEAWKQLLDSSKQLSFADIIVSLVVVYKSLALYYELILASENRHKSDNALFFGSLVPAEERMSPGDWLRWVFLSFCLCYDTVYRVKARSSHP